MWCFAFKPKDVDDDERIGTLVFREFVSESVTKYSKTKLNTTYLKTQSALFVKKYVTFFLYKKQIE